MGAHGHTIVGHRPIYEAAFFPYPVPFPWQVSVLFLVFSLMFAEYGRWQGHIFISNSFYSILCTSSPYLINFVLVPIWSASDIKHLFKKLIIKLFNNRNNHIWSSCQQIVHYKVGSKPTILKESAIRGRSIEDI